MAALTIESATILPNGRLLRLTFTVAPVPTSYALPDWRPGYDAGARITLSTGAVLECRGGIAQTADFGQPDTTAKPAPPIPGGLLPPGTYKIAYTIRNNVTGLEEQVSPIGMIKPATLGVTPELYTIAGSKVPVGYTGNIYLSPDGGDNNSLVLYRGNLAAGTFNFHLDTNVWDDPTQHFPGFTTLRWSVLYAIPDSTQIVTYGTTGITVSGGAGLITDRYGNTTAAFLAVAVTNQSWCDADGFSSQSFAPIPLTGVHFYLSSVHGVQTGDQNLDYLSGQNRATPLYDIDYACRILRNKGQHNKGAHLHLLQGDTWTLASVASFEIGGPDRDHPFVVEDYWHDFSGTGQPAPGVRPVIQAANRNCFQTSGGGLYLNQSNVIVRRLSFKQTNLTDSNAACALSFSMDGTDWFIDDCRFERFGKQVIFQSSFTYFIRITLNRCIGVDGFDPGSDHAQGFYLSGVKELLVSQCCVDYNGRKSADLVEGDIFSHNFYLPISTVTSVLWGNYIGHAGSHGAQMRSGGWSADNVWDGNALQSFGNFPGSWYVKNVAVNSRNFIDHTSHLSNGRGSGFEAIAGLSNTDQGIDGPGQGQEFNFILHTVGTAAFGQNVQIAPEAVSYNLLIRNNTIADHGIARQYSGVPPNPATGVLHQYDANIYTTGNSTIFYHPNVPAGWGWLASDRNCLFSTLTAGSWFKTSGTNQTLATWQTQTGTEANPVLVTPLYIDGAATLGSYYATLGGTATDQAWIDHLRNRPMGVWDASYDPSQVWAYYAAKYLPTNLDPLGSGTWDYCGAADYRSLPPPPRHRSLTLRKTGVRSLFSTTG